MSRLHYGKLIMSNTSCPLVSIGLPVFNGDKSLENAIECLLEQDYPNFEIIISDNASTDSTQMICERYSKNESRIKYFRIEKNLGAIWNFNHVFELSSGIYFYEIQAVGDDNLPYLEKNAKGSVTIVRN